MRQDDEVLRCSGISWTISCRLTTTSTPHHSIFTDRMLFLTTNQQCQSSEGSQEINNLCLVYSLNASNQTAKPVCLERYKPSTSLCDYRAQWMCNTTKINIAIEQCKCCLSHSMQPTLVELIIKTVKFITTTFT